MSSRSDSVERIALPPALAAAGKTIPAREPMRSARGTLNRVKAEDSLVCLARLEMNRLADLGGEELHVRTRDLGDIRFARELKTQGHQASARYVRSRLRLLTRETVVEQHLHEAVGRRSRDAELRRRVGDAHPVALCQQREQANGRVNRTDRVCRLLGAFSSRAHARSVLSRPEAATSGSPRRDMSPRDH